VVCERFALAWCVRLCVVRVSVVIVCLLLSYVCGACPCVLVDVFQGKGVRVRANMC
jgi:hypothetical protein